MKNAKSFAPIDAKGVIGGIAQIAVSADAAAVLGRLIGTVLGKITLKTSPRREGEIQCQRDARLSTKVDVCALHGGGLLGRDAKLIKDSQPLLACRVDLLYRIWRVGYGSDMLDSLLYEKGKCKN